MVDPLNASTEVIAEIGSIGRWIEAIGLVIFIWIGFQAGMLIINFWKRKTLNSMKKDLERIEKKIDNLSKKI